MSLIAKIHWETDMFLECAQMFPINILLLVLMNAKASAKKTLRNFLCKQHILWSNICFLTDFSECLSTVLTLEWKSTSLNLNIIRLDHLTKKPWWQMHYGDFKSNLPWKHESIDKKLCFFLKYHERIPVMKSVYGIGLLVSCKAF